MAVLVLHELERAAVGREPIGPRRRRPAAPPRRTAPTASASSVASTSSGSPVAGATASEREPDESRHRAFGREPLGERAQRRAVARRRPPGSRRAARGCCRRPGRANSESAGDAVTSGVTSFSAPSASAPAARGCRGPAATPCASSGATFIRPDTIRSRIAGVCTRDSSKRKALTMCAFSTAVWLFQNSVAWV